MTTAIIALGLLYFAGHLLTHVFDKTKIPDVLILILFGIIIGPVFHFVDAERFGSAGDLLTSIALIIILFDGGVGLQLTSLIRSAKQALALTGGFFFVTAGIVFCIMYKGYGYSPLASAIMGFICGGTASSVIIPMIGILRVGKEAASILIIESALTTVLCIITVLGILRSYDSGDFEIGRIIGSLISSVILASIIGVVSGLIWLRLLRWIKTYSNTQFATFAFMFIVYGIAEGLDFSGPIAALAFGIVLGNQHTIVHQLNEITSHLSIENVGVISDAEKKLYKEIVFLLKIFFFVYLGISIPIEQTYTMGIALSIVMALFAIRPFVTKLIVRRRVSPYDNTMISLMVPKGLATAVLAGLPSQYGMVEGPDIQAIAYNVILFSIIITSVLIPIINNTPIKKGFFHFFSNTQGNVVENNKTTTPLHKQ
ncbi:MAG: cation:proton antiporter [Bacteroidales bacterium]|nr:cation:proton antiporter [Bacteroidales bacterium]